MMIITRPRDPRLWLKIRKWPEEVQEQWDERAAIIEFDGGLHRAVAEKEAYEQIKSQLEAEQGKG